jgi:hypothetical protein
MSGCSLLYRRVRHTSRRVLKLFEVDAGFVGTLIKLDSKRCMTRVQSELA